MTHATLSRFRSVAAACARDLSHLGKLIGGGAATVGLALLACAACCAAPLAFGMLGVGGVVVGATCADLELPFALGVVAVGVGLFVGWRRRASAGCAPSTAGHGTACNADGSCGCAPARGANVSP